MRAVNLLPSDLRGAAPKPARGGSRPEPVQGIGAYVVLGALALCVAAFASYVVVSNGIKQKQADLDDRQARRPPRRSQAAALKPYADFEALATARVETVRGLAAARFDWEQVAARPLPRHAGRREAAEPQRRHRAFPARVGRRQRSAARLDPGAGDHASPAAPRARRGRPHAGPPARPWTA